MLKEEMKNEKNKNKKRRSTKLLINSYLVSSTPLIRIYPTTRPAKTPLRKLSISIIMTPELCPKAAIH